MEHVEVTELTQGLVRLTPDKGYRIADYNGNTYGDVICKTGDVAKFKAVAMLNQGKKKK